MNFRLIFCVAMGVFTTFLGVTMLVHHLRSAGHTAPLPKPNFSATAEFGVDPESGEKVVFREITVSTRLAESSVGKEPAQRVPAAQVSAVPPNIAP